MNSGSALFQKSLPAQPPHCTPPAPAPRPASRAVAAHYTHTRHTTQQRCYYQSRLSAPRGTTCPSVYTIGLEERWPRCSSWIASRKTRENEICGAADPKTRKVHLLIDPSAPYRSIPDSSTQRYRSVRLLHRRHLQLALQEGRAKLRRESQSRGAKCASCCLACCRLLIDA